MKYLLEDEEIEALLSSVTTIEETVEKLGEAVRIHCHSHSIEVRNLTKLERRLAAMRITLFEVLNVTSSYRDRSYNPYEAPR